MGDWSDLYPKGYKEQDIFFGALSADKTLDFASGYYQFLDPNGASRNIILPAEGLYEITNVSSGTHALNIKESAGGSVIISLSLSTGYRKIRAVHDTADWEYLILGRY